MRIQKVSLTVLISLIFIIPPYAQTCTTLFIHDGKESVIAKTLDYHRGQGFIYINKRNVEKKAPGQLSFRWISKYASMTVTETGREFPWEGMNEAGLSVDIMTLTGSQAPPANDPRPAFNGVQWIQFILDTSASTAEAVENARRIRLPPKDANHHYMICDASGTCAVIEFLNGDLVIHSGNQMSYMALTNNTYEASIAYLQGQLNISDRPTILQGTSRKSLDRFARGALLALSYLPGTDSIDYAFKALQSVAQSNFTKWRIVWDLRTLTGYFRTAASPALKSVRLRDFEWSCASPVKIFDVNAKSSGEVTGQFEDYSDEKNRDLIEQSDFTPDGKAFLEKYPGAMTRCLANQRM